MPVREGLMISRWLRQYRSTNRTSSGFHRNGNKHPIELRHVVKTYESVAGKFTAFRDVNMQVDTGEFVAVVGKSGSGKTN